MWPKNYVKVKMIGIHSSAVTGIDQVDEHILLFRSLCWLFPVSFLSFRLLGHGFQGPKVQILLFVFSEKVWRLSFSHQEPWSVEGDFGNALTSSLSTLKCTPSCPTDFDVSNIQMCFLPYSSDVLQSLPLCIRIREAWDETLLVNSKVKKASSPSAISVLFASVFLVPQNSRPII